MFLVFDIKALPKGIPLETWYQIYNYFNIILYDSTGLEDGKKPYYMTEEGTPIATPETLVLNVRDKTDLSTFKSITKMHFDQYEDPSIED